MKIKKQFLLLMAMVLFFGVCEAQQEPAKKVENKKEVTVSPKSKRTKKGTTDRIEVSDRAKPKENISVKKSSNKVKATIPKK